MELRQLRYFVVIADCKNMTKASGVLHIAQSALSTNIKNLEEELGVILLVRSRKGVELSEYGRTFIAYARSTLREAEKAKESLKGLIDNPSGEVTLAVPPSVIRILSVPLYKNLSKYYPNIRLNLIDGIADELFESFKSGDIDQLIVYDPQVSVHYESISLFTEQFFLISNYKLENTAKAVQFTELGSYPLCRPPPGRGRSEILGESIEKHDMPLNLLNFCAHPFGIIELVRAGVTSAILPWSICQEYIENGELIAREIVNPRLIRHAFLLNQASRTPSIASTKVAEVLKNVILQVISEGKLMGESLFDETVKDSV
ncbi:MAG: LysR family nitrogen assimilation transcriptional regulator [Paraglaciecola sp.]|jgi:LysR family nitrogen assimilation transcriptional regulator